MNMLKNVLSNRGYSSLTVLAAVIALAYTACASTGESERATEKFSAAKRVENERQTPSAVTGDNEEIESAKDTVRRYWKSTNSSYENMYELFSSSYKRILSQFDGINNAEEFKESIPPTERTWPKQTYQSAKLDIYHDPPQIQIVVLAEWKEKGYGGVMTFIFELVKEDGEWKIANIMF